MRVEEVLLRIRRLRRADAPADPELAPGLVHLDDAAVTTVASAGRLLADVPAENLASPNFPLRPLRVAVTGTFTPGTVEPLLRVALLRIGIAAEIHVSGFDQVVLDLSDPGSALAEFRPDVTLCLLHDGWFLPAEWDPGDLDGLADALASGRPSWRPPFAGTRPAATARCCCTRCRSPRWSTAAWSASGAGRRWDGSGGS